MHHFGPKNGGPSNSRSVVGAFFNFAHNETGQEVHQNCINNFSEKNIWENWPFYAKDVASL